MSVTNVLMCCRGCVSKGFFSAIVSSSAETWTPHHLSPCTPACLHMCIVQYNIRHWGAKLVGRLPIHQKKKPVMTLVYVCCSSECLYTGEEHLCGQWRGHMHPVLLVVEMPTVAICLVFQLHHLPLFWFKHDGQLNTTVTHFHVWVRWSRTQFMQPGIVASTLHSYHARVYRNHVQDHPFKRTQAWTGLDAVSCAQFQASA